MAQRTRKRRPVVVAPDALNPLEGTRTPASAPVDVARSAPASVSDLPLWSGLMGEGVIDDSSQILDGVVIATHLSSLDTPAQPTNIVAVTGLLTDGSAYIRLTWDAMPLATQYEVRWKLASDIAYSYINVTNNTAQISGLIPNSAYKVNVESINGIGNASGYLSFSDQSITSSADTTAPGTPTTVVAGAGVRSVIIGFTANTEIDLDHYVIEIYSDAGLVTLVKTFTGLATVWSYNNGAANTQYWARVKAVDTSGNSSAWSGTVTTTTGQIANSDIQAGTITADRLVAATITVASGVVGSLDASVITVGTLAAARIAANTLTADKMAAGTFSAAWILAGSLKTASSGVRGEFDSSGMRLYGYQTPFLRDANFGGFFSGLTNGTGALTVPLPKLRVINDIMLLFVQTANQPVATPTGWTSKDSVGTGVAGAAGSAGLQVFWRRVDGSEASTLSVADGGDHQMALIECWGGCITTGDPFDTTITTTDAVSNTSLSLTGVTTTIPNSLVVAAAAAAMTTSVGGGEFSAWTNANLGGLRESADSDLYAGGTVPGAFAIAFGAKAAAGATGATTVTLQAASKKVGWVGALKADIGATVNLDATTGNGTFAGTISGGKHYAPSTAGDRVVLGYVPINTYLGAGVTAYRNLDSEGPANYAGIFDFIFGHDFPQGAGTGNISESVIAAIGSDASDLSLDYNKQGGVAGLTSGYYKAAIGPGTGPTFEIDLTHTNSTLAVLAGSAIFSILDTASTIQLAGVQNMSDLKKAPLLVQGGTGTVTWPGANNFSNTLSVTFATAFGAAPSGVSTSSGNNTANGQAATYLATSVSTTGFTMRASNWQLQPALNAQTTGNYVASRA